MADMTRSVFMCILSALELSLGDVTVGGADHRIDHRIRSIRPRQEPVAFGERRRPARWKDIPHTPLDGRVRGIPQAQQALPA